MATTTTRIKAKRSLYFTEFITRSLGQIGLVKVDQSLTKLLNNSFDNFNHILISPSIDQRIAWKVWTIIATEILSFPELIQLVGFDPELDELIASSLRSRTLKISAQSNKKLNDVEVTYSIDKDDPLNAETVPKVASFITSNNVKFKSVSIEVVDELLLFCKSIVPNNIAPFLYSSNKFELISDLDIANFSKDDFMYPPIFDFFKRVGSLKTAINFNINFLTKFENLEYITLHYNQYLTTMEVSKVWQVLHKTLSLGAFKHLELKNYSSLEKLKTGPPGSFQQLKYFLDSYPEHKSIQLDDYDIYPDSDIATVLPIEHLLKSLHIQLSDYTMELKWLEKITGLEALKVTISDEAYDKTPIVISHSKLTTLKVEASKSFIIPVRLDLSELPSLEKFSVSALTITGTIFNTIHSDRLKELRLTLVRIVKGPVTLPPYHINRLYLDNCFPDMLVTQNANNESLTHVNILEASLSPTPDFNIQFVNRSAAIARLSKVVAHLSGNFKILRLLENQTGLIELFKDIKTEDSKLYREHFLVRLIYKVDMLGNLEMFERDFLINLMRGKHTYEEIVTRVSAASFKSFHQVRKQIDDVVDTHPNFENIFKETFGNRAAKRLELKINEIDAHKRYALQLERYY